MKKLIAICTTTLSVSFMVLAPNLAFGQDCSERSAHETISRTQKDLRDLIDQNTDGKIDAAQIDYDIQKANDRIALRLKQIDDLQNNMGVQGDEGEQRLEKLGQLETAAMQKKKALDAKLGNTFEPEDKRKITIAAAKEIDRLYVNAVKIAN